MNFFFVFGMCHLTVIILNSFYDISSGFDPAAVYFLLNGTGPKKNIGEPPRLIITPFSDIVFCYVPL